MGKVILSNNYKDKRILITGCGYKPVNFVFKNIIDKQSSHLGFINNGREYKLNIGSAVALKLAAHGAIVHIVSKSIDKLQMIKQVIAEQVGCDKQQIEYSVCDLMNELEVKGLVQNLLKDKTLYWVQAIGLGAGSYKVKDDNPYLPIDKIEIGLLEAESNITLKSTHLLMLELLPIFRKQQETRIAIITSMSAVRGYNYGCTHCAAKAALDRYANSAMLGLYKENIFVSVIRPGAVDTGMYDNNIVQEAVKDITDEYGCDWRNNGIRLAPPSAVGGAVSLIFSIPAHIPSLNLVAQGQFPHEGS